MTGPSDKTPAYAPDVPVWQSCLGPDALEGTGYFEGINESLPAILRREPRNVLELGCASGLLGAHVKQRHPGACYTGVEMSPSAAREARTRLDRVIEGRLEDLDYAAHGIAPGSIDTLFAGDVLEHLYDPWRTLVSVLPMLAPDAQVAASIPNVRNLFVQSQLHNEGTWRYAADGLLDVTHIRFFAFRDVMRLFVETGYAVEDVRCNLDPRFANVFEANRNNPDITLQAGRLRLEHVTPGELQEYCTLQFIVLARPKPRAANDPAA
jgi:SAM-dependent methyltransferase